MNTKRYANDCEIIIGLVGPVGINLDDVQNRLNSYISQFRYAFNLIHLSTLSGQFFKDTPQPAQEHERLNSGMDRGNALRARSKRGDVYALLAINEINKKRKGDNTKGLEPLGRVAHVIRSLKHPDEVETLRMVYGQGFFLLGISSGIESRKKFLMDEKGVPSSRVEDLIKRDDREGDDLGQRTRDVFQMADAFITSDAEDLSGQISKILDLLFSKPISSPTADEYAMFMAYAASLRSADLSRQVGAVIANEQFDIIATGANDVPKFGGGLYWPDSRDQRDYILKKDANEEQKDKIIIDIMRKIETSPNISDKDLLAKGKVVLDGTGLFNITEYGRAVHAEMEALMSSARNGISTRGATLYTTTYPCHNCAKHIVAAGIRRVIYIEPYPKSYASRLHSDSISSDDEGASEKVIFKPFVGVGPRKFVDLFSTSLGNGRKLQRKVDGVVVDWNRGVAELRVPMTPFSYIDSETLLLGEFGKLDLLESSHE
jgi:deoxycytidylate deaminase